MERCLCGIFIVTCVEAAPVMSPGLGSCCASPGRMLQSSLLGRCGCPHGGVLTVVGGLGANCAWWPQAVQHPLPRGGLGTCSLSQPVPTVFPKHVFKLGEQLRCGGMMVKLQGNRSLGAAPCWGHLWGGLWGLHGQEAKARGRLGPISVSGSSLPSLELSARHLSCVMGKQRGAPAGEGCWIPAGAKAASGRDRERAVACARHGGRDAPLGLRAAFLMESRAPAALVSG